MKIENNTAVLKIESMGPADGQPGPAEVDAQYLKPNALITSEDRQVRSLLPGDARNSGPLESRRNPEMGV